MRRPRTVLFIVLIAAMLAACVVLVRSLQAPGSASAPLASNADTASLAGPTGPAADPVPDLSGRVFNLATDLGVPNATVQVDCNKGAFRRAVVSRKDGTFAFRALVDGECVVTAQRDRMRASGPAALPAQTLTVHAGRPMTGLELGLYRTARLSGRVVAGDARQETQGLPGVSLSALYLEAPGHEGAFSLDTDVVTDADGRFELVGLGPGRIRLLAEHADHGVAESADRFLLPGKAAENLVIHLTDTGTVVGVVVDHNDHPVQGADVVVRSAAALSPQRTITGKDGRFELPGIPAGSARVSARAFGYRDGDTEVDIVADDLVTLRLQVTPRPGFGGLVLDVSGRPVPDAAVVIAGPLDTDDTVLSPATSSDDKGRFWLEEVPPPPARARARHQRHGPSEWVAIAGSETDLTLRLTAPGKLVGQVVDELGRPLPAFTIAAAGRNQSVNDAGGRFETAALEPGRYTVTASAADRPAVRTVKFEVLGGHDTDVGTIVLGRGGSVVGTVVGASTGEPIHGASAAIMRRGRTRTGPDGSFKLDGLSSESVSVWIRAPGHAARLLTGVVPPEGSDYDLGLIQLKADPDGRAGLQYSGVGIQIGIRPDRLMIDRVYPGSPAAEAGLETGAAVVGVNGFDITDLTPRQAVEMMRGEPGTEVSLQVLTASGVQAVRIRRAEVQANNR